ncbi:MAG: hypothetical protein ACLPKE_23015, partial [Streptosporangiaceae bacterium]
MASRATPKPVAAAPARTESASRPRSGPASQSSRSSGRGPARTGRCPQRPVVEAEYLAAGPHGPALPVAVQDDGAAGQFRVQGRGDQPGPGR